ncbi:type I phosphomannose isomerase catalytic subunit [Parabacteroides sp. FAFU027]|uniref:type I phosphomannose isomerase catalytic subunit n=1 Tax=Parabacteroides sp. FAFU027 TaxID=2922715 RepID=UPI001FAF5A31|nr:type I phosphomannose isomerase catalytic subunit [Parabacteroides sp. FAFU027]
MYPLKFTPILKSTIWGGNEICKFKQLTPELESNGESWEISHVRDNISMISNGELTGKSLEELINTYGAELLGKKVANLFGNKFPLLIKFIDACDDLSIQVHPDDELARKRHNSFGKTEMWYVISAKENAMLYSGFSKAITPDKYVESVRNNTFLDYVLQHPLSAGDVFFVPTGRVHAIGAGTFVAEIQQTSDVTYRIYDFDRKDANGNSRELHTELAKDAIDYTLYPEYKTVYERVENGSASLVSCPYFETNMIQLSSCSIERDNLDKDSFVVYICLVGSVVITDRNGYEVAVEQGESVLVPASIADVTISPRKNAKLLETYIP